jgi:hypothetical protein
MNYHSVLGQGAALRISLVPGKTLNFLQFLG